jgi:hypothetical protein
MSPADNWAWLARDHNLISCRYEEYLIKVLKNSKKEEKNTMNNFHPWRWRWNGRFKLIKQTCSVQKERTWWVGRGLFRFSLSYKFNLRRHKTDEERSLRSATNGGRFSSPNHRSFFFLLFISSVFSPSFCSLIQQQNKQNIHSSEYWKSRKFLSIRPR